MQPIERVGVFALLFLVVMVVAVWLFDREPADLATEVAANERALPAESARSTTSTRVPQLGQMTESSRRKTSAPQKPATSDWKSRKQLRELALAEQAQAAKAPAGLPVSTPKQALTAAPKPSLETRTNGGRHIASNDPSRTSASKKKAEVLQPKTSKVGTEKARRSPSESTSSKPGQSTLSTREYVVRAGDTLSEISESQLGTATRWKELEALNNVSANQLKVGMKLRLPSSKTIAKDATSKPAVLKPKAASTAPTKAGSYRVGSGDSLWLIAKRQLGDGNRWSEIAALNSSINPDKLVVGSSLVMPTGAAQPKATQIAKSTTPARSTSSKPRVR